MLRRLSFISSIVGALLPACHAQGIPDQMNPLNANGPHLYEVAIFSGYESSANPFGQVTSSAGALGADITYGASASVGWAHHRDRTNFSIRYSGTYSGLVRYSDANGYSQTLSLGMNRQLAPKWTFGLSLTGQDSTLAEVINQPTALSVASQLPADFNDFAAAFGLGSYSTAAAASAILGAPVVQPPTRSLLLGNKVLSYTGSTSLSYSYSPHLSFHASGSGSGGESRSPSLDGVPATNYVLPLGYSLDAGASWNYALSPRTTVGASLDVDRQQNKFQTGYTSTASLSAGRKMGMHWFATIRAGATYSEITQQTTGSALPIQAVGGASLGVKTGSNTFAASYDRSASDQYGSFIGTSSNYSATWNWSHPGSRTTLFANYGKQQVANTGFESFSGWQASAGFFQRLTGTTGMTGQYVYFKTGGEYLGEFSNFSVQSVRLTLAWYPQAGQR